MAKQRRWLGCGIGLGVVLFLTSRPVHADGRGEPFLTQAFSPAVETMEKPYVRSARGLRRWASDLRKKRVRGFHLQDGKETPAVYRIKSDFTSDAIKTQLSEMLQRSQQVASALVGAHSTDDLYLYFDTHRGADLAKVYENTDIAYDYEEGLRRGLIRERDVGPYRAVLNTLRDARPSAFASGPTTDVPVPFDRHHLPQFQSTTSLIGRMALLGRWLPFVPNKYPFLPWHFQISDSISRPQLYTQFDTDAALQTVHQSSDPRVRMIGNGFNAGNSLNLIHTQGGYPENPFPIEGARDERTVKTFGGVTLAREMPNSGFGRTLYISGGDWSTVSTALALSLDHAQARAVPANYIVYKTVAPQGVVYHAIVIMRSRQGDTPKGFRARFATSEMAGVLITLDPELFDRLTPEQYQNAIDEQSLPERDFEPLLIAIVDDIRDHSWNRLRDELWLSSRVLTSFYQYWSPRMLFGINDDEQRTRRAAALSTLEHLSRDHRRFVHSRLKGLLLGRPVTRLGLSKYARTLSWISKTEPDGFADAFDKEVVSLLAHLERVKPSPWSRAVRYWKLKQAA